MRVFKVVKVIAIVLVAALVLGFVVMHLWNWLMPGIFRLPPITFWQAIGLLLLSKLLLGGFHKHGPQRHGWKKHMEEKWERMTPEERERFRKGCRFTGRKDIPSEQDPQ